MISSDIQVTSSSPPASPSTTAPATTPATGHRFSFHDLLSAANPLQYLPIVGTIYRAVTGDVIPEALRRGGSLLVSGLLGGPIGLITNIVETIAEKVTGIDPEKIVAAQLHPPSPATIPVNPPQPAEPTVALPPPAIPTAAALTPSQLAAYGVRSAPSGTMTLGDVEGADVLNTLELTRLGKQAAAAYAANQPTLLVGPSVGSAASRVAVSN